MRSDLDRLRFVFIVTYGRSGSTLLQSLLNSTPGVMLRGENGNTLFHVFRAWKALEDTAFRGRTSFQTDPDRPWFGASDVAPAKFRDAALRAFVSDVLAPPASARVSGFKEIRYGKDSMNDTEFSGYMEFLLEQFPKARIVFNSRNPDSVSRSGWFRNRDPQKVRAMVLASDQRFSKICAQSDRCIHMQYEDYSGGNWRRSLEEMFAFLDLPFDADRISAVLSKPLNHAQPRS